jgi:hypothetical protein
LIDLLVFNGHDTIFNNVLDIIGLTDEIEVLALEVGSVALEDIAVLVLNLAASGNRSNQCVDVGILRDTILELAALSRYLVLCQVASKSRLLHDVRVSLDRASVFADRHIGGSAEGREDDCESGGREEYSAHGERVD